MCKASLFRSESCDCELPTAIAAPQCGITPTRTAAGHIDSVSDHEGRVETHTELPNDVFGSIDCSALFSELIHKCLQSAVAVVLQNF